MLKARKAIDPAQGNRIVWIVLTLDNVDTGMLIYRSAFGFYVVTDDQYFEGLGGALSRAIELYTKGQNNE